MRPPAEPRPKRRKGPRPGTGVRHPPDLLRASLRGAQHRFEGHVAPRQYGDNRLPVLHEELGEDIPEAYPAPRRDRNDERAADAAASPP
eukprot:CAMPEP_0194301574 /NCGR_PEP_ID=MMETSP0169-20130528/61869_2 /TAXON_ID=218684 /ORGANISM="Corethron pennatum, Strain L29A3" /LENGTH=88 /DNA_ID=CAMNT_0039051833 /DNA_START=1030 /DNA_END=1293 /DNA_ORIENTATION=-